MLSFNEFCTEVVNGVSAVYPDVEVFTKQVRKPNIVKTGLIIKPNNGNITPTPTIYLNEFYSEDCEISDVINQVVKIYEEYKDTMIDFDVQEICDFEQAKKRIIPILINTERNTELLKTCPNKTYLDLSIVFYYMCDDKTISGGQSMVLVTNSLFTSWGISLDTLYDVSMNNIHLLGCNVRNIIDIIAKMMKDEGEPDEVISMMINDMHNRQWVPITVVTNDIYLKGACIAFFNPNICKKLAQDYNNNLLILPSSVHESIVVPVDIAPTIDDVKEMVKSINATEVLPEDFLSDSVYFYDRTTGKISIAE